ncbi:MAG: hypothetical protein AAF368_00130 [Planctomycetota bacterium]
MTLRTLSIPGEVAQAAQLSSDAKVVYAYLAPMKRCGMGPKLIAVRLGMRPNAVKRACDQLERFRLIRREPKPGAAYLMTVLPLPELVA